MVRVHDQMDDSCSCSSLPSFAACSRGLEVSLQGFCTDVWAPCMAHRPCSPSREAGWFLVCLVGSALLCFSERTLVNVPSLTLPKLNTQAGNRQVSLSAGFSFCLLPPAEPSCCKVQSTLILLGALFSTLARMIFKCLVNYLTVCLSFSGIGSSRALCGTMVEVGAVCNIEETVIKAGREQN